MAYKLGEPYKKRKYVQYFHFERIENVHQFVRLVCQFGNALINTNGGFLVFGINNKDRVVGINLNREAEDAYRLALDRELRNFTPTVGPNLYRFSVIQLVGSNKCLIEIRIAAAAIGAMYQTNWEKVFVVKNNTKVGPLWPQEMKALIITKYKEELLASKAVLSPERTCTSVNPRG